MTVIFQLIISYYMIEPNYVQVFSFSSLTLLSFLDINKTILYDLRHSLIHLVQQVLVFRCLCKDTHEIHLTFSF